LDPQSAGSISWDAVTVSPATNANFSRESTPSHYYAARETSASTVAVQTPTGNQLEKFLFYRGVSLFAPPLSAKVLASSQLQLKSIAEGSTTIILFERRGDKLGYRVSSLDSAAIMDTPSTSGTLNSPYADFEDTLVAQSLYRDEARIGTTVVTSGDPGGTVQHSAIQKLLQQDIDVGTLPATNRNTLYFVFLPEGVQVVQGGSASCQSFCGYHDSFGSNVYYAVMPYPGCSGCTGGLAVFDALTSTTSHELCESITDPIPGQGWYDDNNGEIGDICAWKTRKLDKYTIQLEWSNKAGSCV
jgi:hypothetical protein